MLIGCVVLGAGIGARYLFFTSPDEAATSHAPRIADRGFEKAASSVCARYVHVFDTATTLSKEPSQAQAGDFLQSIATDFDTMVTQLKALPVTAADQPAVTQWLADWDAYDEYGHEYAAAVRTGAERDLVTHDSARIGALRRRRNGFAHANSMGTCAFN
ncbi:MAG: hypothetical protein NVSMB12_17240 [Acidimicrobiales bacterium]